MQTEGWTDDRTEGWSDDRTEGRKDGEAKTHLRCKDVKEVNDELSDTLSLVQKKGRLISDINTNTNTKMKVGKYKIRVGVFS